jgi:xanthine dehydrogenase accessory factor
MEALLAEIVQRCAAGEKLAMCVLVRARGSTPQAAGAKMLVLADGRTIGTLGGGCVEAEVRSRALAQLAAGTPANLYDFRLDHDYGWDDGLICGGVMDVHVRVLDRSDLPRFESLLQDLRSGASIDFVVPLESTDEQKAYVETVRPPPKLVIAGGGHVGQSLGMLAAALDFRLTVIDDRPGYVTADRFPCAADRIVGDIETELLKAAIDPQTYVVIVTRGHRNDGRALAAVVNSVAKFVGLIGSKRKIKTIFDDLMQQGVALEKIARVHAPIGLEIGAVSPAEIAVSIAAELVAVRRGRDGMAAGPMKVDEAQLRSWMDRSVTKDDTGVPLRGDR